MDFRSVDSIGMASSFQTCHQGSLEGIFPIPGDPTRPVLDMRDAFPERHTLVWSNSISYNQYQSLVPARCEESFVSLFQRVINTHIIPLRACS
jgi:hypothetical protein